MRSVQETRKSGENEIEIDFDVKTITRTCIIPKTQHIVTTDRELIFYKYRVSLVKLSAERLLRNRNRPIRTLWPILDLSSFEPIRDRHLPICTRRSGFNYSKIDSHLIDSNRTAHAPQADTVFDFKSGP